MKFKEISPPRSFTVGNSVKFEINDCGRIQLEPDELVTFATTMGGELDFVRKDWGFYMAPSLNGRLVEFGLQAVLIRNKPSNRYYLLAVESEKEAEFEAYLIREESEVVRWLNDTSLLDELCLQADSTSES